jgi:hypothetical protein
MQRRYLDVLVAPHLATVERPADVRGAIVHHHVVLVADQLRPLRLHAPEVA